VAIRLVQLVRRVFDTALVFHVHHRRWVWVVWIDQHVQRWHLPPTEHRHVRGMDMVLESVLVDRALRRLASGCDRAGGLWRLHQLLDVHASTRVRLVSCHTDLHVRFVARPLIVGD
jgi:hypothetical protein